MKKLCCLILAVMTAASCAVLVSCGDSADTDAAGLVAEKVLADIPADVLLDAAVAAYSADELPNVKYYRSSVTDEDAEGYLDPDFAGQFFLNDFGADIPVFKNLSEYAMCVPQSKKAFEMIVFKLGDESDKEEAKKLLETRFSLKDSGDFGTYVPEEEEMLKNMQIIEKGKYLFMLCTTDNSKAIAAFESLLNG